MSTGLPYSALGQILSTGGEIALGLAQFYGWPQSRVGALFERRFTGLDVAGREQLTNLATAGVSAGEFLTGFDPNLQAPIDSIPINPYLFAGDLAGRRLRLVGEWQFEQDAGWFQTRIDLPDLPPMADVFEIIVSAGRSVGIRCHDKFGLPVDEPIIVLPPRIIFAERAW